jgi:hypothetical protein
MATFACLLNMISQCYRLNALWGIPRQAELTLRDKE